MIRAAYNWNKDFDNGGGALQYLFIFSGLSGEDFRYMVGPDLRCSRRDPLGVALFRAFHRRRQVSPAA
jgi:hypothetical protein